MISHTKMGVAAGAAVILFLVVISAFFLQPKNESFEKPSPLGKQEEVPEPQLSGFDKLVERGLSSYQLDALKNGISRFLESSHKQVSAVAVVPSSINKLGRPRDSREIKDTLLFDLALDDKTYKARLEYYDVSTIQLYLFDSQTGRQVFDSGVLDVTVGQ